MFLTRYIPTFQLLYLISLSLLRKDTVRALVPSSSSLKRCHNHYQRRIRSNLMMNINQDHSSETSRKTFLSNVLLHTSLSISLMQPKQVQATYIDPTTKINLPEPKEIEEAIPSSSKEWQNIDNPFTDMDTKTSFSRLDSKNDAIFYQDARFVEHVDENAVSIMKDYIKNQIEDNQSILDLCSSWTSHIDTDIVQKLKLERISGLGMNEEELKANKVLTDFKVMDLNVMNTENISNGGSGIALPYSDSSFDIVLCQLSIDYLIYPLQVMKEISRVLKPGGSLHILYSNRLFLQKAIGLWTGADDIDHTFTVGSYLYFCDGNFGNIQAKDLSSRNKKNGRIIGDPVYVITATKDR
mmetsp:Transcript_3299/g.3837  ORF Transcript_3299/g.3837 Transcript_3299/m.3837 type:complete len:354 (+) Transcript_3299:91-1152(+)